MSHEIRPFANSNASLPGERTLRVVALAGIYAAAVAIVVAFSPLAGHEPPHGQRLANVHQNSDRAN
jgi:hypothetical protein